jgi:HEAT repeat protein
MRPWMTGPILALCAGVLPCSAQLPESPIGSPMYRAPELPQPRIVTKLPPRLPALWLEALERPEADYKTKAAQAIALAHQRGFPGMEVAVGPLTRALDRPDQHPTVRVAVARALVVLDAKAAAAGLAKLAATDTDVREIVEPALAKWDYRPARATWLERLDQAPTRRGTVLAIRGLAAVKEEKAASRLRELALDRDVPAGIRLEAARAHGVLRPAGSETDAEGLVKDATPRGATDRLVAASLLRNHQDEAAVRQLQALGRDAEPAVAAVALARLVELDPALVLPLIDPVLASSDANVRRFGVEVLFRQPAEARLKLLADRLNDPHPDVRARARQALGELAKKAEWKTIVIREATRILTADDWRGLEQAGILLARLDHKPAADRLLALLAHRRPEAFIAAAWALRVLAVPETLPGVFKYYDDTYQAMLRSGPEAGRRDVPAAAIDQQLSQLGQFLGQAKHLPADGLFRRLIPPRAGKGMNPAGYEARAAAIWALGLMHEGTPVSAIAGPLAGRVQAVNPFDVEDERVRRMSAITLGRMKAADQLETLRQFYSAKGPSRDPVNNACGWAIERITGEKVPPPGVIEEFRIDWFLVPTD